MTTRYYRLLPAAYKELVPDHTDARIPPTSSLTLLNTLPDRTLIIQVRTNELAHAALLRTAIASWTTKAAMQSETQALRP